MKKFKTLPESGWNKIQAEIEMLLHASRDCMRNQGKYDSTQIPISAYDTYYTEAFGMLRTLRLLGYGDWGAVNTPEVRTNLHWWFNQILQKVLADENFEGNNECDHCLEKYGKDGAGRNKTVTAGLQLKNWFKDNQSELINSATKEESNDI